MRVLLDMDGVLADFDDHLFEVTSHLPWSSDQKAGLWRFATDGWHSHPDRKELVREVRRTVEAPGWFASLPVLPGAKNGVAEIIDRGHTVWVVSKPLEANPTCASDKYAWIAEHFPELAKNVILAPQKHLVSGDVLIDDAIKAREAVRADWLPVHFPYPHNAHQPGLYWNWDRDFEIVEAYAHVNGKRGAQ